MAARIRKRCTECGVANMVRPREVRCKVVNSTFGGQRYCWGVLEAAPIQRATVETGKLEAKLQRLHGTLDDQLKGLQREMRKIEKTRRAILATERGIARRDNPQPPRPRRVRRVRDIDLPDGD